MELTKAEQHLIRRAEKSERARLWGKAAYILIAINLALLLCGAGAAAYKVVEIAGEHGLSAREAFMPPLSVDGPDPIAQLWASFRVHVALSALFTRLLMAVLMLFVGVTVWGIMRHRRLIVKLHRACQEMRPAEPGEPRE
jgi:hypothetical protein